ncbi:hypothetical protein OG474_37450 [Kribbella sp. NBC_01505]|uniref:hypothetical protein n=1 Tax=Kribbella sp. NBC_01505 TaxID=2903580 RepID=UPI00386A96B9
MRNRVCRGLVALGGVFALLLAFPASTATADTIQTGNNVCSMYVNSFGFGAFCSSGEAYYPATPGVPPPTWREKLNGQVFIPCRDFEVPQGIKLPKAPRGKKFVLRLSIADYDLDTVNGGDKAHLTRAIVPVSPDEEEQCQERDYMKEFWWQFGDSYPAPILQVKPTYTPRVNVPAYFTLTPDSAIVQKTDPKKVDPAEINGGLYDETHNLIMRGLVVEMTVDPGDGSKPFTCPMGVTPLDDPDGYDDNSDPFTQLSTCKHVYKRSSANQPDGMYTVKLDITWEVSYWINSGSQWQPIGRAHVQAVQRLPVQEVQAIGG